MQEPVDLDKLSPRKLAYYIRLHEGRSIPADKRAKFKLRVVASTKRTSV